MDAEDPHQSKLIKLISAEGHEFYIEKRCAMVSGTIKTMLSGQFAEARGEVRFPEIPGIILERVIQYLYYKVRYTNSSQRIPQFVVEPGYYYNPDNGCGSSIVGTDCCRCLPGSYCPGGNDSIPCPSGTYNINYQSSSLSACTPCQPGTYSSCTGSTSSLSCTLCNQGTYNPNTGQPACTLCNQGTYNPNNGSISSLDCIACSHGTYNPNTGSISSSACTLCNQGTYNPNTGQSACTLCNQGTYNPNAGSNSSSACIACSKGTYSISGQSACIACNQGTYNPNTGQSICIACSQGTYNPSTGGASSSACTPCSQGTYSPSTGSISSSVCTPCSQGTYNPNTGSTSSLACLSCPINTYSSPGLPACLSCPSNLPIAPPGSSECSSANNVCTLPGEGNVGIIPLVLMIPFAFIGSAIYYVRSRTSSLESLSLISTPIGLAVTGLDLISDGIFILYLLSGSFIEVTAGVRIAGAIFIVVRFLHPVTFALTIGSLFGITLSCNTTIISANTVLLLGITVPRSLVKRPTDYGILIDTPHWKEYSSVYALLALLSLIESQLMKYLPWTSTPFTEASGGYPDFNSFRLCSYGKLVQSSIIAIIQLAVLSSFSKSNNSSSVACDFILIVSLLSTIVPLLITAIEVFFQATTLAKDDSLKTGTKPTTTTTSNPMLSNGSSRRISTTHTHHHHHKQVQDLLKKYPDIYHGITSTFFDDITITHHDDIVSMLSTKYPSVYSEINNNNNDNNNNNGKNGDNDDSLNSL